jgi:hypothetical protein
LDAVNIGHEMLGQITNGIVVCAAPSTFAAHQLAKRDGNRPMVFESRVSARQEVFNERLMGEAVRALTALTIQSHIRRRSLEGDSNCNIR